VRAKWRTSLVFTAEAIDARLDDAARAAQAPTVPISGAVNKHAGHTRSLVNVHYSCLMELHSVCSLCQANRYLLGLGKIKYAKGGAAESV
jgi:hypothetical protein